MRLLGKRLSKQLDKYFSKLISVSLRFWLNAAFWELLCWNNYGMLSLGTRAHPTAECSFFISVMIGVSFLKLLVLCKQSAVVIVSAANGFAFAGEWNRRFENATLDGELALSSAGTADSSCLFLIINLPKNKHFVYYKVDINFMSEHVVTVFWAISLGHAHQREYLHFISHRFHLVSLHLRHEGKLVF